MKLHLAMTLAERVQRELAGFCLPGMCTIAGSIRRARPEVNDIDFVILPKPIVEGGGSGVEAIKARCRQKCRVITDGDQNFICAMRMPDHSEFQLDIFFAHNGKEELFEKQPTNYGSLLLCRTGSQAHNIKLCSIAKQRDMKWSPYQGVLAGGEWVFKGQDSVYEGGTLIASETEEEIFEALGLQWIPPALREVDFNPGPGISQILSQGNDCQGNEDLTPGIMRAGNGAGQSEASSGLTAGVRADCPTSDRPLAAVVPGEQTIPSASEPTAS